MQEDFEKYSTQIGILPGELPRLVMERNQMDELKKEFTDGQRSRSSTSNYGLCFRKQRIIYVNINKRISHLRTYKNVKYTDRELSKHKTTYRDLLHTLVHELVHYRWKMEHGTKFEQRIREILRGRIFSDKSLYDGNITPTGNKYVTDIVTNIEKPTPIPKAEPTPEELSKLFGDDNRPKPKNIAEFTGIINVNDDGFLEIDCNSKTSITELLKCLCRKEVKFRIEEIN